MSDDNFHISCAVCNKYKAKLKCDVCSAPLCLGQHCSVVCWVKFSVTSTSSNGTAGSTHDTGQDVERVIKCKGCNDRRQAPTTQSAEGCVIC